MTAIRTPVAVGARVRPMWVLEVGLVAACYAAYAWIRDVHGRDTGDRTDARVAAAHGRTVEHLERTLHLDPERGVQALIPRAGVAVHLLNGFYLTAHVVVTLAVLVFLLLRRPLIYRRCRTALLVVTALALVVFALYPTAPPRLLASAHVRDTLTAGGWWSLNHGGIERITDPYAAMPSLHLGWSTWVALSLAAAFPVGARRLLFTLYPLLVTWVVLSTGAHWFLDTVAGAGLSACVWWLSGRFYGRRLPADVGTSTRN